MNFYTLILLGGVTTLGAGASATIGTYGMHRPAASPLQMPQGLLATLLAAGAPAPTHRRRLVHNVFTTKGALRTAVREYDANSTTAIASYVPIADWDVTAVTDMKELISNQQNFNADISSWNTSRVTDMREMFKVHSTRACPSCALTTAGRPPP